MKAALETIKAEYAANFLKNYSNDPQNLASQTILIDRSDWGLLELKGQDRLRFLHNQTSNAIERLKPGQGCETIFLNSTGRTLDFVTVYASDDSLLILVSPQRRQFLLELIDRYIFPFDKVEISDLTDNFGIFTLIGTESGQYLQKIGIPEQILTGVQHSHYLLSQPALRLAVGTGLDLPGYTLIVAAAEAGSLWENLIKNGVTPADAQVWEYLRIHQGRPAVDRELTEDYNPLEAGLWRALVFDKGCYIGQETIARLNTYKGIKQRLWGIKLSQPVPSNTPIILEAQKVGLLTSVLAGGEGLKVQIGEATGELIPLPFLSHEYPFQ
ncbi:MAG: folate-binding protein YgfZ [Microcystis aeruginosa LL13-03]|nr:folate-binding protein YgfZ [Microcystis aeruginosa LL13-03]